MQQIKINDFDHTSPKFCTGIAFASFFKREASFIKDFTKYGGGNYGCYYGVIHCYVIDMIESNGFTHYTLYSFKLSHNAGYQRFSEFFKDITEILDNQKYKIIKFKTRKDLKCN